MSQSLEEIATQLKDNTKKVQLIYAFNGSGKTRLSRAFKDIVAPKSDSSEETNTAEEESKRKILYYNAFTEDLFSWDNDLENDSDKKLRIQPNNFTHWIFHDQGQEWNITKYFQNYTHDKLTPLFHNDYNEVTFSLETGDNERVENIKISKGEESCFIWCIFYSILKQAIEILDIAEPSQRETNLFNNLEYIFIDDPVSSLDENHLIELAVNIADLIKKSPSRLKFIITTHNPLFYNVLHNSLNNAQGYLLKKHDNGLFELIEKNWASNTSFSHHRHLLWELEKAIKNDTIERYHFNFLRNILEKMANFLGYNNRSDLLPGETEEDKKSYWSRIINLSSHSTLSTDEVAIVKNEDKRVVKYLVNHIKTYYKFY